ncbi:MAG: HNH endonuclease [Luteibaculum sp.]
MFSIPTEELWKDISFPGLKRGARYQISDLGRLRIWNVKSDAWRLLTPIGKDYLYYTSFKSEFGWRKRITKPIHRLVAGAFLPLPGEEQKFVIHLDYNKKNNAAKNLKWATQKDLTLHNQNNPKVIAGRIKNRGVVTNSKLTESDVIRLKKKLNRNKNRLNVLAREFGITHTQLNRIRNGENWSHVVVQD